ncbi:MAG: hypothetical protein K8R48_06220 [Alphaproteobacteria bacterium]|nr:hypothetical protein [Alphaproteobacteria bacterium]
MSHEYAISRVKDALEKSGGNHLKAQRLILSWLEKDHTLLFGLVTPHIQSIITHAIAHVTKPPKKISFKDQKAGEFGNSLLESLSGKSGDTGTFGEAAPRGISKPGKASKTHIDAINALVSASKNKSKKSKK